MEQRDGLGRIRVRAAGEVTVEPDLLLAEISVVAEDRKLEAAHEKHRQQVAKVLSVLRTHGIEGADLRTVNYHLGPVYESRVAPENRPPRLAGHRVEQVFGLRLRDLKRAGRILDAVIEAGVGRVRSLRFGVEEEAQWRRVALRRAVEEAVRKAQAAAAALGKELVALESLEEEVGEVPRPMYTLAVGSGSPETPVEPGELILRAEVTAVFTVYGRLGSA